MTNILFVCSGNIFRSMSAELLTKQYLKEIGEKRFVIRSAGVSAKKQDMHAQTKRSLDSLGIDYSQHKQTKLTQEIIDWADTIICMADYHQQFITEHFNTYTHLYNEFALGKIRNVDDVDDVLEKHEYHTKPGDTHVANIITHLHKTTPVLVDKLIERFFLFEDFVSGKRQTHRNQVPFQVLLKNTHALAFLSHDIPSTQNAHVLVIPKKRYSNYDDIPARIREDMNELAIKIGSVFNRTHQGYNILLNNKTAAGQYIYHAHLHIIPRDAGDGIEIERWNHTHPDSQEHQQLHEQLMNELKSSNAPLKGNNNHNKDMTRVAINGFGRIGRMVFRAGIQHNDIEFVAINDLTDTKTLAYLLKYDSVHGKLKEEVSYDEHGIIVNGTHIPVYAQRDPSDLPWSEHDVDVVAECTGFFRTKEAASKHLDAGAKKVLISAPASGEDVQTIVKGINEHEIDHKRCILSNASCTTNCLGHLVKVLHDNFEVENGFFNTIHSFTGDQNHIDGPHKDLRRGRACANNIVPTTSGAAVAVTQALPELEGKIQGMAVRVPTPDGSVTDFTCTVKKSTSVEEINELFRNVSEHHLQGVLEYSEEEIVSTDIIGNPHSCIFDSKQTQVIDGNKVRVFGWYDNEWGYSNRMIDIIKHL